jgi:two-component system, OmpR family, sensor histidine kinase KdpD
LPLLNFDMVLMEQVLFNLFDNAAKYAPQGSRITITARHESGSIVIRIDRSGAVFTIRLPVPVTPRLPAEAIS